MRTNIEQQVMAGVGVVYAGRLLASRTAVELYVLVLSCAGLASLVSVPHVLTNLQTVGATGIFLFAEVAVMKTSTIVQVILGAGLIASVMFVYDLARSLARPLSRVAV